MLRYMYVRYTQIVVSKGMQGNLVVVSAIVYTIVMDLDIIMYHYVSFPSLQELTS